MRNGICLLIAVALLLSVCASAEETQTDAYLVEPGPRAALIADFNGRVRKLEMEADYLDEIYGWNDGEFRDLTVGKRLVNDTPLYEVYLNDGAAKPLIIFLHGGGEGGNKTEFMETACRYAKSGFYSLLIDVAGYGESDLGPIDAMIGTAETVWNIDGLIEYYNTMPEANAGRFCLYGHSMGGFIAFSYAAHGQYRPTAIACSCSSPDLTEIHEWPLYAATDYGVHIPNILGKAQIYNFAKAYSPSRWPERFLDVTVYACNGLADDIVYPTGCQQLEEKLKELGGDKFTFLYMEDRGHGDQYVLEDFQPFDTLKSAVENADFNYAAVSRDWDLGSVTDVNLKGVEFSFVLPEGWRETDGGLEFGASYMSPEGDRALDFWLLDDGEPTLESFYEMLLEQKENEPGSFNNLELREQSGVPYLFHTDNVGQFVAYIKLGEENTLYMSMSDNGYGEDLFREVVGSVR